jgi:hypothetical protein
LEEILRMFDECSDHLPVGEEGHRLLAALGQVVAQLAYDADAIKAKTNAQLCKKYGCAKRTLQGWRSQGAPLDGRLDYLLDWWASRRTLPRGTAGLFREQLEKRGWGRTDHAQIRRGFLDLKTVLAMASQRL